MHEGTTNATMLLHEGGKLLANTYYTREDAMLFTTFIHKMDRAFTLMHQGSNQELNDLYKTHFVLERLSVKEGSSLTQAKTHCFHQLNLHEHYRECVAYLRTAISSKTIASRQRSRKRTISGVTTRDTSNKDKKMNFCNGVSLKNINKRFSTEEWLKLSADAKEFIRKNRKPFTKHRRVSQVTFSDGTATTEVEQPAAPAIRQSRIISAVTSFSRRSVYRVSKLHSSPGSMLTIHTARCEIDNHADTCCFGKNFIPLAYTNRVCDVHAFTDQVDTVRNIPVVTGATATALPNGEMKPQILNAISPLHLMTSGRRKNDSFSITQSWVDHSITLLTIAMQFSETT